MKAIRHPDFRTKDLDLFFTDSALVVTATGLLAYAPWAEVEIDALAYSALLFVGKAVATLTLQDYLFLRPLIARYKGLPHVTAPATPERPRLG